MLILHLIFALTSIVVTGFALISPSIKKQYASYSLIAGTIATGTVLTISSHSHLLQACMSGLVYLAVVGGLSAAAYYRLVRVKNN